MVCTLLSRVYVGWRIVKRRIGMSSNGRINSVSWPLATSSARHCGNLPTVICQIVSLLKRKQTFCRSDICHPVILEVVGMSLCPVVKWGNVILFRCHRAISSIVFLRIVSMLMRK